MLSCGSNNWYSPRHAQIKITYLIINIDRITCLTRLSWDLVAIFNPSEVIYLIFIGKELLSHLINSSFCECRPLQTMTMFHAMLGRSVFTFHITRQIQTWCRRCGNSESPIATRIFSPTVYCHQCPAIQTLCRRVNVTSCKQYLTCATWRRQRQLHFATLWCTKCHHHLNVLQRLHDITCVSTAVGLYHQICCGIWTQTPDHNTSPSIIYCRLLGWYQQKKSTSITLQHKKYKQLQTTISICKQNWIQWN